MSIEQGYALFLQSPDSLTIEEYQVYTTVMKSGCLLLKYDPSRVYKTHVVNLETEYVWKNLLNMLGQNVDDAKDEIVEDVQLMEKVTSSMNSICEHISHSESGKNKRKADFYSKYRKFENIFEKIDIIKHVSLNESNDNEPMDLDLKLQFDLFVCVLHSFKLKEPDPPSFRILIRK